MSLAFFKCYIGDYLADTQDLGTVEHGIYFLLLLRYYAVGPLPDDFEKLAAIARISVTDSVASVTDRQKLKSLVERFFLLEDGMWHNRRADEEIIALSAAKSARSEFAKSLNAKRWGGKRNDKAASAKALGQDQSLTQSQNQSNIGSVTDPTRARYQNQSQNQKRGGAPPPPADAVACTPESNGHAEPDAVPAERLAAGAPPGMPDPPHGSAPVTKTPPDAISGDLAVELPRGFPRSEADAVRLAGTVAAPPEFIRTTWTKALGRGGRDSKDVLIRYWPGYMATEWSYEQDRRARQNGNGNHARSESERISLERELARIHERLREFGDGSDLLDHAKKERRKLTARREEILLRIGAAT